MTTQTTTQQSPATPTGFIKFFDLDKIRFIIKDATALEIAYAYQDLVFAENAVFIIQFHPDDVNHFYCFFNNDCFEANRTAMLASLHASAELNNATIEYKGLFELIINNKTDSFDVKFLV